MESPGREIGRVLAFPASGREPWKTKRQVAEFFQVSEKTVERWVAAGMPCFSRGRTIRFQIGRCEEWLGAEA